MWPINSYLYKELQMRSFIEEWVKLEHGHREFSKSNECLFYKLYTVTSSACVFARIKILLKKIYYVIW